MSEEKFDYQLLGRVLRLATPFRGLFASACILAIVLAPLSALRPYLIQRMVDDYIFKFDIQGMTRLSLIILGFLILEAVLKYFLIYSTNYLGQSIIRDLRVRVFQHIT